VPGSRPARPFQRVAVVRGRLVWRTGNVCVKASSNSEHRRDHRRAHLRFEIVGSMPGALVSTQTLHVRNLGVSGALVEAGCALPEYAEYQVQLVLEQHVSEATVKVRRVVEIRAGSGEPPRYQIGLEFLSISAEAEDEINRLIVASLGADMGAEV
jgi:PilZ domain